MATTNTPVDKYGAYDLEMPAEEIKEVLHSAASDGELAVLTEEIDNHKIAEVLDHPDGSVTIKKLADSVVQLINKAQSMAEAAQETADSKISEIPIASLNTLGGIKLYGKTLNGALTNRSGLSIGDDGSTLVLVKSGGGIAIDGVGQLYIVAATDEEIETGTDIYKPVTPATLKKVLEPLKLYADEEYGTAIRTDGRIEIVPAEQQEVEDGIHGYKPLVPSTFKKAIEKIIGIPNELETDDNSNIVSAINSLYEDTGLYPIVCNLSEFEDSAGNHRFTLPAKNELLLLTIDVSSSFAAEGGSTDGTSWSFLLLNDEVKYTLAGNEKLVNGATYLCQVTKEPVADADYENGELTVFASLGGVTDDDLNKYTKIYTGTCSTSLTTATKIVTTKNGDFKLENGAVVNIYLGQTTKPLETAMTFNIDGTGDVVFRPNGIDDYSTISYTSDKINFINSCNLQLVCKEISVGDYIFELASGSNFLDTIEYFLNDARYATLKEIADGIDSKSDKPNYIYSDETTASVALEHNTETRYTSSAFTALTISLPDTYSDDYISSFSFVCGADGFNFTAPDNIYFTGEDCINGIFIPCQSGKVYDVVVWYNGIGFKAAVA